MKNAESPLTWLVLEALLTLLGFVFMARAHLRQLARAVRRSGQRSRTPGESTWRRG